MQHVVEAKTHYILVDDQGNIWTGGEVDDELGAISEDEVRENRWLSFIVSNLDGLKNIPITANTWETIFVASPLPSDFDPYNPSTFRKITDFPGLFT